MAKCCKNTKVPLTVEVLDKAAVLTPENADREVLLLTRNSAGSWVVKALETLAIKTLREALDDPLTAFLLLSSKAPEIPPDPDAPEDGKEYGL